MLCMVVLIAAATVQLQNGTWKIKEQEVSSFSSPALPFCCVCVCLMSLKDRLLQYQCSTDCLVTHFFLQMIPSNQTPFKQPTVIVSCSKRSDLVFLADLYLCKNKRAQLIRNSKWSADVNRYHPSWFSTNTNWINFPVLLDEKVQTLKGSNCLI